MARGLDHIVHAVADLDGAAQIYRQLGFTVGARNKHPWGTHNHIVQLPGFFIELLTLAEREQKWNAFMADPEWIAKRTESEKDGMIIANISSSFLQPTAFSAMK